jgi:hypothetical protein
LATIVIRLRITHASEVFMSILLRLGRVGFLALIAIVAMPATASAAKAPTVRPALVASVSAPSAPAQAPLPLVGSGQPSGAAVAAAANCGGAGPNTVYGPTMYCDNVYGAPLTIGPNVVDRLRTTRSWFACRREFPNHPNGEGFPHPYRWEWTQGDDHGNWGWANDRDIYSETDPLRVCPW